MEWNARWEQYAFKSWSHTELGTTLSETLDKGGLAKLASLVGSRIRFDMHTHTTYPEGLASESVHLAHNIYQIYHIQLGQGDVD